MAHVHKQTYSRPIPPGAEYLLVKRVKCVRWKGRSKQWQVARVSPDRPGRCLVESAKWYVTYRDAGGAERTVPGFADRAATDALMVKLVGTAQKIAAGLLPPEAAKPKSPLSDLLARWHKYILHGGAAKPGAARQHQRARDVVEGIGATVAAEITPTRVREWTGERRAANRHNGKPFGESTGFGYIGAVKSFTRWLAVVERAEPVDHLSALKRPTKRTELRIKRRALVAAELEQLFAATRASAAVHYGLIGYERHALYLLACSTGLRAEELSRLRPQSFDLDASTVALPLDQTKNKEGALLPVAPDVMEVVKRLFRGRAPLWPNRRSYGSQWWSYAARMIRHDLKEAGIAATDEEGRRFDFHALRGQFATDLDRAGVSLARAQKLMRHSTPALTAKHYMRADAEQQAADVAKLRRSGS